MSLPVTVFAGTLASVDTYDVCDFVIHSAGAEYGESLNDTAEPRSTGKLFLAQGHRMDCRARARWAEATMPAASGQLRAR